MRKGLAAVIASQAQLQEIFEGKERSADPWQRFSESYGGARWLITFSRVGMAPRSDEALVAASRTCAGLCGSGHLLLLKRRSRVWNVAVMGQLWVS
jgi:hypothetical protein